MGKELVRFSVAMPDDLLMRFDELVATRGLAKNRSEVIRDLVRDALADSDCEIPGQEVMGTLTIAFNHHTTDVREKIDSIQHEYLGNVVASLHVHVDEDMCLEVIVLRGEAAAVQSLANLVIGTKGVIHGNLTMTVTGHNSLDLDDAAYQKFRALNEDGAPEHDHQHKHSHGHTHEHTHHGADAETTGKDDEDDPIARIDKDLSALPQQRSRRVKIKR
jgi:CopG family nickel-responsive transcriptional regulator